MGSGCNTSTFYVEFYVLGVIRVYGNISTECILVFLVYHIIQMKMYMRPDEKIVA